MSKFIEGQSVMVQRNGLCCHDTHNDHSCDFTSLRRNSSIEVKSTLDGYDSGIGSSPRGAPSPPSQPPQSLPLNVTIKPKQRRRKRGASTAAHSFDDVFKRSGRVLGSGAFSSVEVCSDRKTGKEYAVKIIQKDNWYTRSRVQQEVEILYRGRGHPNIIQLEQFFEGEDHFYLVFEMMRGGALIDHIKSHVMFTEKEASIVVKCVTLALKHLHGQGIAHRDLKFENILCGDNFTEVKICDFDLGGQKFDFPDLSTPLMDSPVGSAEFMAPEVVSLFEGHHSFYDKLCDMWSLGVLIYIMIYGRPPFTGRCGLTCGWDDGEECKQCQESLFRNITSSELHFDENMNVSDSVKDLISRLLQKDSQLRLTAVQVLEHEWVKTEGTDNRLYTAQQLKRNKSSALNLCSFSSQANEHVRRINSNHSLATMSPNHSPGTAPSEQSLEEDPFDRALQNIDIGESWYEDNDIFYDHDDTLSAENMTPSNGDTSHRSPTPPHTPTLDNTPVQTIFVYPGHSDTPPTFYFSSDDED